MTTAQKLKVFLSRNLNLLIVGALIISNFSLPIFISNTPTVEAQNTGAPQWGTYKVNGSRDNFKSNVNPTNILQSDQERWSKAASSVPGLSLNEWGQPFIGNDGTIYVMGYRRPIDPGTNRPSLSIATSYLFALDPATGNNKWAPYAFSYASCDKTTKTDTWFNIAGIAPNGDIVVLGSTPVIDPFGSTPQCAPGSIDHYHPEYKIFRLRPGASGPTIVFTDQRVEQGVNHAISGNHEMSYLDPSGNYVAVGLYQHYNWILFPATSGLQRIQLNPQDPCSAESDCHNGNYSNVAYTSNGQVALSSYQSTHQALNIYSGAFDKFAGNQNLFTSKDLIVTKINDPISNQELEVGIFSGYNNFGKIVNLQTPNPGKTATYPTYLFDANFAGNLLGIESSVNATPKKLLLNQINGYIRSYNLNALANNKTCWDPNATSGWRYFNGFNERVSNCSDLPLVQQGTLFDDANVGNYVYGESVIIPGYIYYTVRDKSTGEFRLVLKSTSDLSANGTKLRTKKFPSLPDTYGLSWGDLAVADNGDVVMNTGSNLVTFSSVTTFKGQIQIKTVCANKSNQPLSGITVSINGSTVPGYSSLSAVTNQSGDASIYYETNTLTNIFMDSRTLPAGMTTTGSPSVLQGVFYGYFQQTASKALFAVPDGTRTTPWLITFNCALPWVNLRGNVSYSRNDYKDNVSTKKLVPPSTASSFYSAFNDGPIVGSVVIGGNTLSTYQARDFENSAVNKISVKGWTLTNYIDNNLLVDNSYYDKTLRTVNAPKGTVVSLAAYNAYFSNGNFSLRNFINTYAGSLNDKRVFVFTDIPSQFLSGRSANVNSNAINIIDTDVTASDAVNGVTLFFPTYVKINTNNNLNGGRFVFVSYKAKIIPNGAAESYLNAGIVSENDIEVGDTSTQNQRVYIQGFLSSGQKVKNYLDLNNNNSTLPSLGVVYTPEYYYILKDIFVSGVKGVTKRTVVGL